MTALDLTIVNVALPGLGSSFGSPLSVVQWVVTGYTLALATVLPVTGWAVDRWAADGCSWSPWACSPWVRGCAAPPGTPGP